MKNPLNFSLLFVALLASCSSCKKNTEQATPTTQTTNCLIATQTTKELVSPSQTSTLDPETVTINGESFKVTTTKKSAYTYDKQGRILTEYNQYAGSQAGYHRATADSVSYQYSPTAVTIRTVAFTDSSKEERMYTIALNSQGFAEEAFASGPATYDKDGYLISLKDEYGISEKVDNGNVTEWVFYIEGPGTESYTNKNYYDLSKSSLPTVQSFYGKKSRNLQVKSTVEDNNYYQGVPPVVYTTTYTHLFDNDGRIRRQIERGKDGEHPFIFGGDLVRTKDFTYNCP